MRTSLRFFAAAALVAGLALGVSAPAQAEHSGVRVWVDIGDVVFSYGRPYYRHGHHPVYVVHDYGYPRYYYYRPAPVVYVPPRYYRPPPPYYYGPPGHWKKHHRHHHRGHYRDSGHYGDRVYYRDRGYYRDRYDD